jgi:hypothetical protein
VEELGDDLVLGIRGQGDGRCEIGVGEGGAGGASADGGDGCDCTWDCLVGRLVEDFDDVSAVESVIDLTERTNQYWVVSRGECVAEFGGIGVGGGKSSGCKAEGGNPVGANEGCGEDDEEADCRDAPSSQRERTKGLLHF